MSKYVKICHFMTKKDNGHAEICQNMSKYVKISSFSTSRVVQAFGSPTLVLSEIENIKSSV